MSAGVSVTTSWRSVLLATAVSILGDQLAKVAVSVLVFQRTGSAGLTAVTYGLTLVPELLGGLTLGGMADRYTRRTVMVVCAGIQAALVGVMAIPTMSILVLAIAVSGVSALAAPARAAQNACTYDLLGPARVGAGQAHLTMLSEVGQLGGLAGGAGVVALVGTDGALVGDAISFAASAVLLWFGLAGMTPTATAQDAPPGEVAVARGTRAAWREIRTDPTLRSMLILVMLVALAVVPSGIMAPLVHQLGSPDWWVGLLLAADCAGLILAAAITTRIPSRHHRALIGPLAVMTYIPLCVFLVAPGPALVVVLLAACGAAQAYLPLTKGVFGERIERRAPTAAISAYALVSVSMRAAQGIAVILGGALVALLGSPTHAIGVVGVVGVALTVPAAWGWHRTRTRDITPLTAADTAIR